jgi:hypothetical protein
MHTDVMRRYLISLMLAAGWGLTFAASGAAQPSIPSAQPTAVLFTQTAAHGSLTPGKHKSKGDSRYVLTLRGVAPQLVWFQDRPGRHTGHLSARDFVRGWKGFGFKADRPNAALSVLDGKESADTVVIELSRPRYDAKRRTMRYSARPISRATGTLSVFATGRDSGVPRRFGAVSLFIDNTDSPVINGCWIEPNADCPFRQMAGVDLSGLDLSGANLFSVNLTGANLTGANLSGANLTSATLTSANLSGTSLSGANLPSANLSGAILTGANLTGADLTSANLTGVDVTSAYLCNTMMPDGSYNNSDCGLSVP